MKKYVFVINEKGERNATYIVGVHGTLEEINKKALAEHQKCTLVVGDDELFHNLVGKDMLYIDGKCVEQEKSIPQDVINEIEINRLKAELSATDYKCLKYVDGALTEEEYAEVKKHRASLREQINQLEEK